MPYAAVADVKVILQIPAEDTSYDTELAGCAESADAVIDSWLLKNGLTMPSPVRNLKDSSTYLAAWLFNGRVAVDKFCAFKVRLDEAISVLFA